MIRAISSVFIAVALTACASEATDTPEWFDQREAELNAQGTPPLQGIPRGATAQTNSAHWQSLEQELAAAEAALRASPRSEPAAPGQAEEAAAAEAAARAALESTASKY